MHGKDKYLHRTIAGWTLGRDLTTDELVHHVDYNKLNNRRSNLLICDEPYHKLVHRRWDAMLAGFDWRTHSLCSMCKTYHPVEDFAASANKGGEHKVHNICKAESNRIRREKQYSKGKFNWSARMMQQIRRAVKKGVPFTVLPKEEVVHE